MGMSLEALMSDRATVTVKYRGHEFKVTFRPNDYTEDVDRSANADTTLLAVVESWELEQDGVPIPVTAEGLRDIPTSVRFAIRRAIIAEVVMPSPEA